DPFNDVDVDVIFSKDGATWRVPTFWRGGSEWTVRFASPSPGEYTYRLESTDKSNPDLNGQEGRVRISAYTGTNELLRHGPLRVSPNKRYFEHADGTPFFWLGDTWWCGMSSRLSWEGFQKLTADRKAKGFTVVQIVAGLVPEFGPPSDPGFCNEGGCVWDPEFKRINPRFFDYVDRRVQHLVDSEIAPAIVGAWNYGVLAEMGVAKMKKHWRYIIARYGAYAGFWIVGGEVFDPPEEVARRLGELSMSRSIPGGWTDLARYLRATDPYHHPVTVHEIPPPYDFPLQDESLTDFDLFQSSHFGWSSIAVSVAQLNMHYARAEVTKPVVEGEIGYERIMETHLEDFQRMAFWLTRLNGAAGHTYGAAGTWMSYTTDKPNNWTFLTWEEGINHPGSYQVGLGAKLLRQYPWWRIEPHPEWVTPRGTTLLEPRSGINGFDLGTWDLFSSDDSTPPSDADYPTGEWKAHGGNFRLPYAAGIPGDVRFIYVPCSGLNCTTGAPTVLGLELGIRYHAYYWEPSKGIKIDLGAVERPSPGATIREDKFDDSKASAWTDYGTKSARGGGRLSSSGEMLAILNGVSETDLVAAVDAHSDAEAGLVLRFQDTDNYLAAVYSSKDRALYLLDRKKGVDGRPLGHTPVSAIGPDIRLTAEVRGGWAAVSITDGQHTCVTPIVDVIGRRGFMPAVASKILPGGAGLRHSNDGTTQSFGNFELRKSPTLVTDEYLERKLYDARGGYRGELSGPEWDDFAREKVILLDAYKPPNFLIRQDSLLVLERMK
ncbi:MAG: DUF4038 domain-containing protein, partial [Acidobacteria bacterium]|nr:DUF4038 domain-containing protein [Acidobacteriota bacterium]